MSGFDLLRAAQAANAYSAADTAYGAAGGSIGGIGGIGGISSAGEGGGAGGVDFGAMLQTALGGAVKVGEAAESSAMGAITGHGDLTQVVTAVSRAQLALQTTVAVRDRVLQAYQDIIKMSI